MSTQVDVVALALSIRDGNRTMLRPHEEQALAVRVLCLEGVHSAASEHRNAVVLCDALKGAGDSARDVKTSFEKLRAQIEVADRVNAAMYDAARPASPPPRRNHPIRQLARWWKTVFASGPTTLRRSS